MQARIDKYAQLKNDQFLNIDTGNVVQLKTARSKTYFHNQICTDDFLRGICFLVLVDNIIDVDTAELTWLYNKITDLDGDNYYNLDTKRKLSAKTAHSKDYYCTELKFCSNQEIIFNGFIKFIKTNKLYTKKLTIKNTNTRNEFNLKRSSIKSNKNNSLDSEDSEEEPVPKSKNKSDSSTSEEEPVPKNKPKSKNKNKFKVESSEDSSEEERIVFKSKSISDNPKFNNFYDKIQDLPEDKLLNLTSNKAVKLSTADSKAGYCLSAKCCSDNIEFLQQYLNYINLKYKTKHNIIINKDSSSSPVQAAKNRHSYKKATIPPKLKDKLWDTYCHDKAEAKCYCCREQIITSNSFAAGHVIAESNKGDLNINNIRPICNSCNSSMGTTNLFKYMREKYMDSFTVAMRQESINIYILERCESANEYHFKTFYKNYAKYCKQYNITAINKQIVKYYLAGRNMLDDDDNIMIY